MGQVLMVNDAWATTATAVLVTDTTLTLTAGQGARFPTISGGDWFYVTVFDQNGNKERCLCTARATDVLTVTRGVDGSTPLAFANGSRVEMHWNAGIITDLQAQIAAAVLAKLNAYFPPNMVMLFSGALTAIPAGWVLCNGANGTPNLSAQFIIGAGNTYAVGATGGSLTQTLTTANLPSHNHTLTDPQHTHGITQTPHGHTYNDPGHTHIISAQLSAGAGGGNIVAFPRIGNANYLSGTVAGTGVSFSGATTGVAALSNSPTSIAPANTGNGAAVAVLPPYYALAYICKIANWT